MGNRIAKLIKDGSDSLIKATYYVRDAQGNVMTVYQWQIKDTLPEHIAAERYIYGSSRLGVETTPVEMIGAMPQTQDTAVRFLQYKHYEISNHLGNVLAVVSDKKVLKDMDQNMLVDEYHPDMVSAHDYSPFGVHLYGRSYVRPEGGDTIPNDFNSWQVAWSPSDASLVVNANNELEVTAYADYKGAWFDLPTKPGQEYHVTLNIDMGTAGSVSYGAYGNGGNPLAYAEISQGGVVKFTFVADNTSTQIAVLMVHSNGPETFKVVSATYHEYKAAYRFGFNGMEKDDEVKGSGNHLDFGARVYDSRLGRFLSIDPRMKEYLGWTPYLHSANNPIMFVDDNGEGPIIRQLVQTVRLAVAKAFGADHIKGKWTNSQGRKVNQTIQTRKQIWEKRDESMTHLEFEGSKNSKFNIGGKNTSNSSYSNDPPSAAIGGASGLNVWPLVVVVKESDDRLGAERIGSISEDGKMVFNSGPFEGKEIDMDDVTGNILNPDTKEVLFTKPSSIKPLHDEILSEDAAAEKFGSAAEGKGARVFNGTSASGGTEKTKEVLNEIE